jgi:excisionase family DNA binding protein
MISGGRGCDLAATVGRMVIVDGEEYLTAEEAAEVMGVKPATVYAYVSRGILQSYRQGMKRQRLYRRADVDTLTRMAPSAREPAGARKLPEIPLAESWIRH